MTSAVLGSAVRVKSLDAVMVSASRDSVLCPSTVTVTNNPVAAPAGMTNAMWVASALAIGAGIVPPPCLLMVTWGLPVPD